MEKWYTRGANTAECFELRGFFTIKLDSANLPVVPRQRGMSQVGNLIRVPQGKVMKSLNPWFVVTVAGEKPFQLPEEAVLAIYDEEDRPVCVRSRK